MLYFGSSNFSEYGALTPAPQYKTANTQALGHVKQAFAEDRKVAGSGPRMAFYFCLFYGKCQRRDRQVL